MSHNIGCVVQHTDNEGKENVYGPFPDTSNAEVWIADAGITKDGGKAVILQVQCAHCAYDDLTQPTVTKEDNVFHINFSNGE